MPWQLLLAHATPPTTPHNHRISPNGSAQKPLAEPMQAPPRAPQNYAHMSYPQASTTPAPQGPNITLAAAAGACSTTPHKHTVSHNVVGKHHRLSPCTHIFEGSTELHTPRPRSCTHTPSAELHTSIHMPIMMPALQKATLALAVANCSAGSASATKVSAPAWASKQRWQSP